MRKNRIIIAISLALIATTSLLASNAFSTSLPSNLPLGTQSSLLTNDPKVVANQQQLFSIDNEDDPLKGGGFGLIGDILVSTYEWQPTKGTQTKALRLGTSEYYLIASCSDTTNDLYLTTIQVENDNGIITNTNIDTWEIGPNATMQAAGSYLCNVAGDIYAITYQQDTGNNILVTFSASSTTGLLQKTPIDTLILSNKSCSQSIIRLTPSIFAIASQKLWNNTNTGILETIYIDSSGNIGNTINDTQNFSVFIDGLVNPAIQLCTIDSDTLAIIYTGTASDGYLTTYNISSTGAIQDTNTSWWEYDASQAITPNLVRIATDYYGLVYSDSSADGIFRVFRINNLGVITKSWIDALEFDTADCWYPQITFCGNTSWNTYWYAITYRGTTGDGFITMIEITKSGYYLSDLIIDRLEFDTLDCQWTPSLLFVNETYYLIIYPGTDSSTDGYDGWAATINIYANMQPPSVYNPNPANQATAIDPTPTLSATVSDADKGGVDVTWYTNLTGAWTAFGKNNTGISPIRDQYEYDPQESRAPDILRLGSSDYYLIVSAGDTGTDYDGFLRTFKVWNTNGSIKKSEIDRWEYDTSDGYEPSLVYVTDDIYAVAYRDVASDRVKVFTVRVWDENGSIQKSMIDVISSSYDGSRPHIIRTFGNYYAISYTEAGTGNVSVSYDGFIETIQIDNSGNIGDTVLSTAEFDTADASNTRLMMIDSDTILICYQGTSNDGFIRTYNISSLGVFINTTSDIWEFDGVDALYPNIMQIGTNRYAITYRTSGRMYIRTANITDTGKIPTKLFIDTLTYEYFGSGVYIRATKILETSNQYLIVYASYPNSQLIACTINISQDGFIEDDPVDKTRIADLGQSLYNFINIAPMGNGFYLLAYELADSDGFLVTLHVTPSVSSVIQQIHPGFNTCGARYWWRVDASDGKYTTSQTYSFTTQYAPNANNDAYTVNEDSTTQLSVLANDNDPESNPLTIISVSDPLYGSTSTNGATVTYQPDLNYYGADLFTYTISDGHGGTDSATVSITVNPVNDAPIANDDTATVTEDSSNNQINVLTNDADIDGDTLSVTGVTTPAHGTTSYTSTYVLYTPSANYNGPDSFSYTVSDGHGGTDTALVTITVTAVNDAPVANDDTATVVEDSTGNQINVLTNDNDIDADPLSITGVTQPAHGTVTYTISSVFYSPNPNYNGVDTFTYTIIDGYGGTDTAIVTVTVTPVNDAPNAVDDTATVTEDSTSNQINVRANDNDIDGDALSITSVTSPSHGTSSYTATYAIFTPLANYNGPDSFTYTISDGHGGTDTATITITVTPVNDAPVAYDDTATVIEDSAANNINVRANDLDIDGDPLSVISVTQPIHGSSTFTSTSVTYTPTANYSGSDSFSYTLSDGQGGTDTALVTITVTPVNDAPIAYDDLATIPEDSINYVINVRGNDIDVDGDVLTIVSITQPSHGSASTNGTRVFYSPSLNYFGTDSLIYTISDGYGGTDSATVSITVTPVNDPPVAFNDTVTVAEDSTNNLIDARVNDVDTESNPLTITSVTQPSHGSASTSSGFVFYSPAANYNGQDSFTYTISDGNGGTDVGTIFITVTPMNDAPNAINDTATVAEDSSSNLINVLANDNDPDGDALSIASVTNPPHGSSTTNGNYVFYTPDLNYYGTDSFFYTMSDGHGGTDTATVTITVAALSDPPVAMDDTSVVPKDSINYQLNVLTNDYDPDNNPLTITSVTTPLHGTTSTNGQYVYYTPTTGYTGPDSCSYTISDGTGYSDTAVISLTVAIINDPPNANNDAATVLEDSTANQINVLANDNDPNSDPLSIISVTQPPNGQVTFTTSLVQYTPNLNFHGSDSFTYTISDGGSTDTATVSVTITSVNDAPVALDDTATVSEDSSTNQLNVQANDYDEDADTLAITTVTTPTHGSVTFTAIYVLYTPAQDYYGMDSFVYTLSDGHGGTDTATVTVTVTAVNDPPTAVDDLVTVNEDSSANQMNVRVNDFDVDGDTISITAVTQPVHGSLTFTTSLVSYTPAANYFGADSFTYTISDGHGSSDTATVDVTVLSVNDPPVAGDDTVTVIEDSTNNQIAVQANDNDIDGDSLSISGVTTPSHGSVTYTTIYVYYTPTANYFGSDSFSYTISDGNGGTDVALVSITVTGVNDPPVAADDVFTVSEDSSGNSLNVRGNDNDPDNNPLSIVSVTPPSQGTATFTAASVYYTPQANYAGTDSFTYTIADGQGGTDTATVTLTITPLNDPPVATDDTISVIEDSSANQLNVRANDVDIDGDSLTITSITQPTHGTATQNGVYIFYTPVANYNGFDSLTYTISDGHGSSDSAIVTITVTPVNDPPIANDDAATVAEDSINNLITVLTNDVDPDFNTLSVTSVTAPLHGTTSTNGVFVFYTPAPNYVGFDSFTYTIDDAQGGTDTAVVTLTVTQVNDAPNAVDDSTSVVEDSSSNLINVLLNDIDLDGDTLIISAVTQPSHGFASFTVSIISYTPTSNFNGADSFTYTISDGHGGTDTAVVSLLVTPLNDVPVAGDDSIPVLEDSSNNQLNVLINDVDIDGDSIIITGITQPTNGVATFTASYVYYTPNPDYNGPDALTYTISDGQGGTDTASVSLTVTSQSDAPVALDDSAIVLEDSSNNLINVLANDYDPESSPLLITSVTQPTHGTSSTNGAFVFYTPAPNYNGADSFTYTISDGGSTDTAAVSLTITATNDAPSANDDTTTIVEDSSNNIISVLLNDNDIDGDSLTVIGVTQPPHGSVTFTTSTVSYTPVANYVGADSFSYTVSDGHGGTDTALVTVTITNINDAPNANDDVESVIEDSNNNQIDVLVNDIDVDGDLLSLTSITQPSHGTAFYTTSIVSYTPTANYNGPDSLTYTISDGHGGADTATIQITVISANDPPIANDDTVAVIEDSLGNLLDVLSNDIDPENNPLLITSVTQPAHGTSSTNGAFVFYTPAPNYNGPDSFVYSISDGNGGADSATITLSISASNDAPNAGDDSATVPEDSTNILIDVLANDVDIDGDSITIISVTQPAHGSVTFTPAQVFYTPTVNYYGPDSFTYSISDSHSGADTGSVSVLVTGVNDPPVASDDTAIVPEDSSNNQINVRGNDIDIDGDTLTIASVTQPSHGSSSTDGFYVYYTPTINYIGPDSFTYTLSDGNGGTDDATVFTTVSNTNDPPVATDDTAVVNEDSLSNLINVLSNDYDPDNNTLTIIGLTQPAHGISSTNGVFIIYTPLPDFNGSDLFTYTISDGTYADSAVVFITVTGVNDAPVVSNIPGQTITEGSTFAVIYLDDYVSDVDNADAEMNWTYSGDTQLTVSIVDRVASIIITNPDWSGSETIMFRATDPSSLFDEDPATFTVTGINDPPFFGASTPANGSIGNPFTLNWNIPITDAEGNPITWSIQCSNGQVNSGTGASNGTKTLTLSGLAPVMTYTVWVNATDPSGSGLYTRAWYTFTTKANTPPEFGIPTPANNTINTPFNLIWSIPISDPDLDLFSWSIQCSNGQANGASGASNGTKTLSLSNLASFTTYTVWVNATDPTGSGLYTRRWYAFTTKVNQPPVFGNPNPANGSYNNPFSFTWSIPISDPDANLFSWSIQCSNGQSNSGTGASNGTKTLALSGLAPVMTYTVWVNATDPTGSGLYTRRWYTFSTKINQPPIFGTPSPANGTIDTHCSFIWSIFILDPEGNPFTWSIECSDGQTNSGTGASNGTKSLTLTGLTPLTFYTVWVNATDPSGSGLFTRKWYTFTTGVNHEPVFGTPSPANGTMDTHCNLIWSIPIADPDGDPFSWEIFCSNGQAASESGALNGTKTVSLTGLVPLTSYTVWVNATDNVEGMYTTGWFIFTTGANHQPEFGIPDPENGSINTPWSFVWNIPISDLEGDLFDWTIHCSNGQMGSGTGASNGTKSLSLTNLAHFVEYIVWVNATDHLDGNLTTRAWFTFTTVAENLPPEKPETPTGWTEGRPHIIYSYNSTTVDLNGDQVWYLFDWGDGSDSGWMGPFESGAVVTGNHSWQKKGAYEIKVKAKDTYGDESNWSDPLPITMPFSKDIIRDRFMQFIQLIVRYFRGEFEGMRLIEVLRTEGWLR